MHILIVGGGIAGLTLAYCCRKAGFECTVIEKASSIRNAGYMMDFFGPGYDVAERLGFLPDLARIHYPISRLAFLNANGKENFSIPYASFKKLLRDRHFNFMRGDLEDVLYAKLSGRVAFRFGTTVESFTEAKGEVTVTLSDGSNVRGDLLVGADGIHSQVRRLAFGPEEQFTVFMGCHTAAFTLPGSDLFPRVKDALYTLTAVDRQIGIYPMRGEGVATFFLHRTGSPVLPGSADDVRSQLESMYAGFGWVVPRVLQEMNPEEVYYDTVSQIAMKRWSTGRVILIGDACHAVSLIAGQGASLAMTAAYLLAEELGAAGADLSPALTRYEARFRPMIEKQQRAAQKMVRWFLPVSTSALVVRDALTWLAKFELLQPLFRGAVGGQDPIPPPLRSGTSL